MNDRLEGLGNFEVDARSPVASLGARARRRKREKLGWTGVACAAIATVGALTLTGGSTTTDVSTTGEDGTPTTREQGMVAVPSLVGATVIDATGRADELGLRAEVNEGDSDLAGAFVIAQEPPAGPSVVPGSVIGLRTALPDTTAAQECPGTSHPHERSESADGLPLVEQVERGAVDSAQNPGSAAEGQRLVLGMWNRYAYELDNAGEPTIERVDGFQLMALYDTVDDCPDSGPAFISGAPLTRVVLDRTDFQTPLQSGAGSEDPDGPGDGLEAPPAVTADGLDAHVLSAEVQGPLARTLRVEPLPAGLLLPDRPVVGLVTFSADAEVALPELPFHDGTAEVEGGGGTLGHTGICGYGWDAEGRQITQDPCAAASPAGSVAPGSPRQLGVILYPRTEAGPAVPGRYTVRVPLDGTSTLALVYELRPHDPATPAWATPDASLNISTEEVLPAPAGGSVTVLLEDPFGHEYDTVELTPPGSVRVELPAGVWRIVPKLPDATGTLVRCGDGDQQVVLEAGDDRPITILVNADEEGRCAN